MGISPLGFLFFLALKWLPILPLQNLDWTWRYFLRFECTLLNLFLLCSRVLIPNLIQFLLFLWWISLLAHYLFQVRNIIFITNRREKFFLCHLLNRILSNRWDLGDAIKALNFLLHPLILKPRCIRTICHYWADFTYFLHELTETDFAPVLLSISSTLGVSLLAFISAQWSLGWEWLGLCCQIFHFL